MAFLPPDEWQGPSSQPEILPDPVLGTAWGRMPSIEEGARHHHHCQRRASVMQVSVLTPPMNSIPQFTNVILTLLERITYSPQTISGRIVAPIVGAAA